MCEVARIIGGAGTGKTSRLLTTMEKLLARGYDPLSIGFVSFTRAARREAAERAAAILDRNPADLERAGWFRTLHSVCYRQLGAGAELLAGSPKDREWISEAIGEDVSGLPVGEEDNDFYDPADHEATDADKALALWSVARNRLVPLAVQHAEASLTDDLPPLDRCRSIVTAYEQAKRLDGRSDFTDLLARYAGVRCGPDGHSDKAPEGEVPNVPVWFFDEQQDTSALLDRVCRRLVEGADYAYLCLDPFQSIYTFAGADARHAMAWEVAEKNRHILPQSHRCPPAVFRLGEEILRGCSDYWDRGIKPADREGTVDPIDFREPWTEDVNPLGSWLLIARTNYQARRIAARLDAVGVPWIPTKGNGGWMAPVRNEAIKALRRMQQDYLVSADGWLAVTKQLPSRCDEGELLKRGAKASAAKLEPSDVLRSIDVLRDWGATELLLDLITSGRWPHLVKGAERYGEAVKRWGEDAANVESWPVGRGVRVGTIHSVKGAEADDVLLLTTTSSRVQRSADLTTGGEDAERRVAYVGVTRARSRLLVASEPSPFRMEVPL